MSRQAGRLVRGAGLAALALTGFVLGAAMERAEAQPAGSLGRGYITPSPEGDRYKLTVFGDSLGDGIWTGLYWAFKRNRNVDVIKKSRVSTGFVRTDYYDWNAKLRSILRSETVHIAVIMVGANDMQSIRHKRRYHKVGTEAWRALYGKRVDTFIKRLRKAHAAVYWVGLPIMRSRKHKRAMQVMNEIFREKAALNGVKFIDTWGGFADRSGRYNAYGPDLSGRVRRLRASDGVHFTMRGYRKLAHFVEREIRRDMRTAGAERSTPRAGDEAGQPGAMGRNRSGADRREATPRRRDARRERRGLQHVLAAR